MRKSSKIFLFSALACLAVSSCYEIVNTFVPTEVTGTETFEARMVCADDGSDTQNFSKDWSIAAIRVPEGWTVDVPAGAHEQDAEDWVYYEDGSRVGSKQDMAYNAHLSDLLNFGNNRTGYRWWAFVTKQMVGKQMTACWRNGCDSIAVTFLVTPNGVPGTYDIDFVAGDEEDEKGVEKYANFGAAANTRVLHCATTNFRGGKADHLNTAFSRKIIVREGTAIQTVDADAEAPSTGIYDADGRLVRSGSDTQGLPAGVYVVNGEKQLVK